jgi:cytochrome oxidase Cu insertion factor (SCO1/SenC/PrrC family)
MVRQADDTHDGIQQLPVHVTTTFSKLKAIQTAADQQKLQIDFMIVSLDPKNDTPQPGSSTVSAGKLTGATGIC